MSGEDWGWGNAIWPARLLSLPFQCSSRTSVLDIVLVCSVQCSLRSWVLVNLINNVNNFEIDSKCVCDAEKDCVVNSFGRVYSMLVNQY